MDELRAAILEQVRAGVNMSDTEELARRLAPRFTKDTTATGGRELKAGGREGLKKRIRMARRDLPKDRN